MAISLGVLPATAVGLFIIYYLTSSVRSYIKLRHIPEPILAKFSDLWWILKTTSAQGHLAFADACDEYGSIVRIGPNAVVTSDPTLYRKINANKASASPYRRTSWYSAFKFDADSDNVFSECNEERHTAKRQKLATGYSGKDNRELEPSIDSIILQTVDLIKRKYLTIGSDSKPLDLAELSGFFFLDVITLIGLGEPFGFIVEDKDQYGYIESLATNMPVLNFLANVPAILSIMGIPMVQRNMLPSPKDKVGLGRAKAVARASIAKRFSDEKFERHDMILSFKKSGLGDEEIADEALLQLIAGADTSATIARIGFVSIMSNPQIYRKLTDEVRSIDLAPSQVISNAAALKLPYLQACIKEALRHYPATSGYLPRVIVGSEGDTHNGIYLPPGTTVGQCAWNIQRRNTAAYGPDAAIFRPERWTEASKEELARMDEVHYLIFGHGRYRCLGENIAKIELNKIFFEMFRRFNWSLMDPMKPFEWNKNYGITLTKGLRVIVRPVEES